MNSRYKLFLDYINWKGGITVNIRGCFSVELTPELRWLLKKGYVKRERKGFTRVSTKKCTILIPVKPYEVNELICPCCKAKLKDIKDNELYRHLHKDNCSLRIDHIHDSWLRKNK